MLQLTIPMPIPQLVFCLEGYLSNPSPERIAREGYDGLSSQARSQPARLDLQPLSARILSTSRSPRACRQLLPVVYHGSHIGRLWVPQIGGVP